MAEFSYFPNSDENYLNKIIFELIDTSFISPLSIAQINELSRTRKIVSADGNYSDGNISISEMSVEEVYAIFFNKWNKVVNRKILFS